MKRSGELIFFFEPAHAINEKNIYLHFELFNINFNLISFVFSTYRFFYLVPRQNVIFFNSNYIQDKKKGTSPQNEIN